MFDHRHYVPILKAKRAEFPAIGQLKNSDRVTPLLEAIPSQPADSVPQAISKIGWPTNRPYFVDFLFFDEDSGSSTDPPLAAVTASIKNRYLFGSKGNSGDRNR